MPVIALHTDKFDKVVRSVAEVNGMPGLRQVFVPQPIMGKTAAQLRAYVLRARGSTQIEVFDGSDRPAPYAVASLFLLPSHTENFGLVIAEAMAAGAAPIDAMLPNVRCRCGHASACTIKREQPAST